MSDHESDSDSILPNAMSEEATDDSSDVDAFGSDDESQSDQGKSSSTFKTKDNEQSLRHMEETSVPILPLRSASTTLQLTSQTIRNNAITEGMSEFEVDTTSEVTIVSV